MFLYFATLLDLEFKTKWGIDKAKQEKGLKSNDYRVMGYNGPGVADAKKTWEMLLVLPAKVKPDLAPKLAVPNP